MATRETLWGPVDEDGNRVLEARSLYAKFDATVTWSVFKSWIEQAEKAAAEMEHFRVQETLWGPVDEETGFRIQRRQDLDVHDSMYYELNATTRED